MISDVLSDASADIKEYLDNPVYDEWYDHETRDEIEAVVAAMDALRHKLDAPVEAEPRVRLALVRGAEP
jgi:hypothetical protein